MVTTAAPVGTIQTALRAVANDTGVSRYRPHVTLAESQLTPAQMQARANWQVQFAYGQSIKITITAAGFRQNDQTLWKPNVMVPLTAAWVYANGVSLLIVQVIFKLDPLKGHIVELILGPVQGYTPDPASVKLHAKKGKSGKPGLDLTGAGGI